MAQKNDDLLAKKALKALAEEELGSFIDSKNISDEDLKKALLTAVDINILHNDYAYMHQKKKIKEDA